VPLDKKQKDGPGYVRHYILDMGDCFGSQWTVDGISRRLGNEYVFDGSQVAENFITFGAKQRPWERARKTGGIFGYFSARDFEPEAWRGEYPNPAFMRMTEQDGAWMARILARFEPELVAAAVQVGKYDATSEHYLIETLLARRRVILQRYLGRVSPIADLAADQLGVCGIDLARKSGTVPNEGMSFRAYLYRASRDGDELLASAPPHFRDVTTPRVCVDIPHRVFAAGVPHDAAERYVVLDLANGYAPGPLRVHLYDLGADGGYRLVGIERPSQLTPPN
jgi:hypothetical protein